MTALKIILIYVYGCEKRNYTQIHLDIRENKFENLNFVILDRCCFYQAAVEHQH